MSIEKQRQLRTRAEIFKALGHPARFAMVVALGAGERCVCELHEIVGSDMSTVSKHLAVLRNVGLVDTDKRGKQVFYSLRCPCTLDFIECVEQAVKERGS